MIKLKYRTGRKTKILPVLFVLLFKINKLLITLKTYARINTDEKYSYF